MHNERQPLPLVPGFEVLHLLAAGSRTCGYSGVRISDRGPVVIKTHLEPQDAVARARLLHELEVLRRFNSPRIVRASDVVRCPDRIYLILEDPGVRPLAHALLGGPLPLPQALRLVREVAQALVIVHEGGVLHKDIQPASILVDRLLTRVILADFGIASFLAGESHSLVPPGTMEGTLTYLAPEQTGRMNRSVDHRADLYALGVVLYQCLVGHPPFASHDPLDLVHAHIARRPIPPHELVPSLPAAVSGVVLKLLAKMAEDRYQSARGLCRDLDRMILESEGGGTLRDFIPGSDDVSANFRLPERLYGRTGAVDELLQALSRVQAGTSEWVLVSGTSGIGKTVVVSEVLREIASRRGYFTSGKFDPLDRDIPYASLVAALGGLVRQILAESPESVRRWQARLEEALGAAARVLIDLVPDLGLLLSPRPDADVLPPAEAANRFREAFHALMRVFARQEAPLVIFLDDLQWSDVGTLDLIEALITDAEVTHLLWIGAFRDNELGLDHPLRGTLASLAQAGVHPREVKLAPLTSIETAALVADTLNPCHGDIDHLARIVHDRTGGVPLFCRLLLHDLHADGVISFDAVQAGWVIADTYAGSHERGRGIDELITSRLLSLEEATLAVLEAAACVGDEFRVQLLALALALSAAEVASRLWPAITAGLVQPVGGEYKYIAVDDRLDARYRFVHDRVQQGIITTLSREKRLDLHYRLGMALRARFGDDDGDSLFTMVGHLNAAIPRLTRSRDRIELAGLNLQAGQKAKRATAYTSASTLFRTGIGLLPEDPWTEHHGLAFALHREHMEAEFLEGNIESALRRFTPLRARARDDVELCELYALKAMLETNLHLAREAIATILEGARALGVALPAQGTLPAVLREFAAAQWSLRSHTPETLRRLPRLTDPRMRAILHLLVAAVPPSAFYDRRLMVVVLLRLVRLTVQHGLSDVASFAFGGYGMVISVLMGAHEESGDYADLAVALEASFRNPALRGKVPFQTANFLYAFLKPHAELCERLRDAHRLALEAGDLNFAVFAGAYIPQQSLLAGRPLSLVREEVRALLPFLRRQKNFDAVAMVTACERVYVAMVTECAEPPLLSDATFDERAFSARFEADDTLVSHFDYRVLKSLILYIFGRHEEARVELGLAHAKIEHGFSRNILVDFYFLRSLNLAAELTTATASERLIGGIRIARWVAKLDRWATCCPANFHARALLARAELDRLRGEPLRAFAGYAAASALAQRHRSHYVQALAEELAGRLHQHRGEHAAGAERLHAACSAYDRWDATAKSAQLRRRHRLQPPDLGLDPSLETATDGGDTRAWSVDSIDLRTVVDGALTISHEIDLAALLRTILRLAITSAGARRASLVLMVEGELRVEGTARTDPDVIEVLMGRALEDDPDALRSMLQYVLHTRRTLILDDLAADPRFGEEARSRAPGHRSAMCTPVILGEQVLGVLYLDNDLATGVFTAERSRVIQVFAAQAAVSIEKSRLYRDLGFALEKQVALTTAQARFVPQEFLVNLGHADLSKVRVGDSVTKTMSVLFADIHGYTRLVERMGAAAAVRFLNDLLAVLEPQIHDQGGFVDSYIGDAIMALFDGSPRGAVRGAVEMLRALRKRNDERRADGEAPVGLGIGINIGPLTLGTIGGPRHLKCSVFGDSVNLAARIERLTRRYHVSLLVSAETLELAGADHGFDARVVDRVQVVGRTHPTTLFEVYEADLDDLRERKRRVSEEFHAGVAAFYERRFVDALGLLSECQRVHDDAVIRSFVARSHELVISPPGDDWNGVEVLKEK